VTTPETVESVAGYTPPAVDLSLFRAGTVWEYRCTAWLVTSCVFSECVGQRETRTMAGNVVDVAVRGDGLIKVEMKLERAEWADQLRPTGGDLTGFDQPGVRYQFLEPGHCWTVWSFDSVNWMPFTAPRRIRDMELTPLPSQLEVTLWRNPMKDLTA
jgi:hypothetical protein